MNSKFGEFVEYTDSVQINVDDLSSVCVKVCMTGVSMTQDNNYFFLPAPPSNNPGLVTNSNRWQVK